MKNALHSLSLLLLLATALMPLRGVAQAPDSTCAEVRNVALSQVTAMSAEVTWSMMEEAVRYIVDYGYPNMPPIISESTTLLSYTLTRLTPNTTYEIRVRAVCYNGQIGEAVTLRVSTLCNSVSENQFCYWNLYDPDVTCYYGNHTTWTEGVVDNGDDLYNSRHTVLSDTSGRDLLSVSQLRTIPPGYCYSVRIGDRVPGGNREKVVYRMRVDTRKANMLILRFAMVEDNPNHDPATQPYFQFSILDEFGTLLDSCQTARFIAGDNTGWNEGAYGGVVWHDWTSVGMDLTPYDRQVIQVVVENGDCRLTDHFGYAYFVLETRLKHLTSTACGENVHGVFEAPEGFSYRWYNVDDPTTTVTTMRTLRINIPGTYCCWMQYPFTSRHCGFELTVRVGSRYPVAKYSILPLNSCWSKVQFFNHSCVAIDSNRRQLTSERCETFQWLFDDGETSTEVNPTHLFRGEGLHWAQLTAMLANGACSHTFRDTFMVQYLSDTIYDTICPGRPYQFYNTVVTDSGFSSAMGDCGPHWLHLTYREAPHSVYPDTICQGDTLWYEGRFFNEERLYYILFPGTAQGTICDSVVRIDLTVHPSYHVRIRDTLPLGEIYTVGDTRIRAPGVGGYTFQTVDGCDSTIWVRLCSIETHDSTVCVDALPVVWDGTTFTAAATDTLWLTSSVWTDSIVVHNLHVRQHADPGLGIDSHCDMPQHYTVTLPTAGYTYRWHATPPIEPEEQEILDSLVRLNFRPTEETGLRFWYDYADAPSCPGGDTVTLFPQRLFFLKLDVQPETLTTDNLHLVARDLGDNVSFRQWVVDSVLQAEAGPRLEYEAPMMADSVVVLLIGGDSVCVDTAQRVVPVIKEDLFFPNVFIPGRDGNSLFQVFGTEVDNFELWIYDRRGVQVFHTTDREEGWDGTSGGIPCVQGTYAYVCHYSIPDNQFRTRAGTITLIR